MAILRYKDNYCERFNMDNEEGFEQAVITHENAVKRVNVRPKQLNFYGIRDITDNQVTMLRLDDNGEIEVKIISVSDEELPIWEDTFNVTKLAAVADKGMFTEMAIPVSDNIKLSAVNRSTLSYKGMISEQKCSRIALAKMMEDLIISHNQHSLQLIIIEGKIQSILTIRYKPTDQHEIFKTATSEISNINDYGFCRGYVSHTQSKGVWKIKQINKNVSAYIEVSDSSSGDGGIYICPVISANGVSISFDDSWFSRHCKINISDISAGVKAAMAKAFNNAALLLTTANITLMNPVEYAQNAIGELNKLAKRMGSTQISKKLQGSIVDEVRVYEMSSACMTVWDIVEILWMCPEKNAESDSHKRSLEKTVSRILTLNHIELDRIK